ncbi:1-deoxy-D-xylulose-5-phosphate synthase [Singulisphaera acidiphila]|uniref:1-deoxy-D-xylulose-5-phosphate synthase n=2 Tax=Singulisphaera acidiphila TaxID=466153 RepID=L0DT00_SINAD|nr:1-deoxy-D-xylulose-5-phosphate synthase [Singulisphaera acidiphila]AGA31491.1 1-deoxy-D-xylulose-5-phosphate synthase [Singulisphaera acidiphila DSM 18658]
MSSTMLPKIESPADLHSLSEKDLERLAAEMREELIGIVGRRSAHFASNLGVVELCLALHLAFDFSQDRLIWDTGHQIYPHKLITGRAAELHSIRTKGGLMGYPNPAESLYDLFMTGHAGCAPSTALGLKAGDDLVGHPERHSVAVIGDGAFPSGIVFEALNNAGGLRKKFLVVLNDNQMSICPRVGGLGYYFDKARMTPMYSDWNRRVRKLLPSIPLVGDQADRWLQQMKDAIKASVHGGMLFEELGFTYIGPIDGHDLKTLRTYLEKVKAMDGPVLLHVLTDKGHGFEPAVKDPVKYHAPAPFQRVEDGIIPLKTSTHKAFTDAVSAALFAAMERDPKVAVLTAAMCEGNKLQKIREVFPDRFFDTGICESHAVAFAAGMAKAGARPVVDIYSTFLQRSYDQIFQEVSLQNLPVIFTLDRAGLVGSDGPTHHGSYDLAYMRMFPNMVVMAPGDEKDVAPMIEFALGHNAPVSIRYPKANLETIEREAQPIELGQAEVLEWETDGIFLACGTLVSSCLRAAERLRQQYGLRIGVVNARFAKPLDKTVVLKAVEECGFVLTVEEGCLAGGFGSAVLEVASDAGLSTANVRRLGLPDHYILHAERDEQLAEVGLDVDGIARAALELARAAGLPAVLAENGQACAT